MGGSSFIKSWWIETIMKRMALLRSWCRRRRRRREKTNQSLPSVTSLFFYISDDFFVLYGHQRKNWREVNLPLFPLFFFWYYKHAQKARAFHSIKSHISLSSLVVGCARIVVFQLDNTKILFILFFHPLAMNGTKWKIVEILFFPRKFPCNPLASTFHQPSRRRRCGVSPPSSIARWWISPCSLPPFWLCSVCTSASFQSPVSWWVIRYSCYRFVFIFIFFPMADEGRGKGKKNYPGITEFHGWQRWEINILKKKRRRYKKIVKSKK